MKSVSVAMAKMPKAAMAHNFVLIKAGVDLSSLQFRYPRRFRVATFRPTRKT
jgi:hypothetical protein